MPDGSAASGTYIAFTWIYACTVNKNEQFRHKWHVYTLKQQEPVRDEQTAFKPALLVVVLAEKIFKRCCCPLSLTLTLQPFNPS